MKMGVNLGGELPEFTPHGGEHLKFTPKEDAGNAGEQRIGVDVGSYWNRRTEISRISRIRLGGELQKFTPI